MVESRDHSLPQGFSVIGEFLQYKASLRIYEQYPEECERLQFILKQKGWKTPSQLYDLLAQRIDHDLLFTKEETLILPKLRELALEECERVIPSLLEGNLEVTGETKDQLVKFLTNMLRRDVRHRRPPRPLLPRYPGDKRGTRSY
jgi:hypothetical protein